jgi:hypothetical protein
MIEKRGRQDAENDRPRAAKPKREQKREELRLVANLSYCDDTRGDEECIQSSTMTGSGGDWPKAQHAARPERKCRAYGLAEPALRGAGCAMAGSQVC